MNSDAMHAPQPLLPAWTRLVAAAAVAAAMLLAWSAAQHVSHEAVQSARSTLAPHVTLPAVQIVTRRATVGLDGNGARAAG